MTGRGALRYVPNSTENASASIPSCSSNAGPTQIGHSPVDYAIADADTQRRSLEGQSVSSAGRSPCASATREPVDERRDRRAERGPGPVGCLARSPILGARRSRVSPCSRRNGNRPNHRLVRSSRETGGGPLGERLSDQDDVAELKQHRRRRLRRRFAYAGPSSFTLDLCGTVSENLHQTCHRIGPLMPEVSDREVLPCAIACQVRQTSDVQGAFFSEPARGPRAHRRSLRSAALGGRAVGESRSHPRPAVPNSARRDGDGSTSSEHRAGPRRGVRLRARARLHKHQALLAEDA